MMLKIEAVTLLFLCVSYILTIIVGRLKGENATLDVKLVINSIEKDSSGIIYYLL